MSNMLDEIDVQPRLEELYANRNELFFEAFASLNKMLYIINN